MSISHVTHHDGDALAVPTLMDQLRVRGSTSRNDETNFLGTS